MVKNEESDIVALFTRTLFSSSDGDKRVTDTGWSQFGIYAVELGM